jgi:hypothetical protein
MGLLAGSAGCDKASLSTIAATLIPAQIAIVTRTITAKPSTKYRARYAMSATATPSGRTTSVAMKNVFSIGRQRY